MQLYWDDVNGVVKKQNGDGCVPLYECPDGIWIESWWTNAEKTSIIDFSYTQEQKKCGMVYWLRDSHFKMYNVQPYFLRCVWFPKSIYRNLAEQMKGGAECR